ncbi:hypothetical protein [Bacillus sp. MUM 13]|uniref:hypothetical protein n=1 Tax=Bacillus sp. MUM 13 TaxID=1678001 RepID=UPI0008F5CE66|nr:hypothetical protein [Bacillus sp. MUM 13]OIK12643.1 hypothetical protein BIV59_08110 [Bacillus sp. MUM 13]
MKKKVFAGLSLISLLYQFSFLYTYWMKDELTELSPEIADLYWITVGLFGIAIGIYVFIKYRVPDIAFLFSLVTCFLGVPILGLFVLATIVTSM